MRVSRPCAHNGSLEIRSPYGHGATKEQAGDGGQCLIRGSTFQIPDGRQGSRKLLLKPASLGVESTRFSVVGGKYLLFLVGGKWVLMNLTQFIQFAREDGL